MQKIERYGVIALVLLLVTILAVSLWGESKDGGLFSWKKDATKEQADATRPRPLPNAANNAAQPGAAQPGAVQPGAAQPGVAGQQVPAAGSPVAGAGAQPAVAGGVSVAAPNADPAARTAAAQRAAWERERQLALQNGAMPNPANVGQPGLGQQNVAQNNVPPSGPLGAQPAAGQGAPGANAVPVGNGAAPRNVQPIGGAPVVPGAPRTYTVKAGDTLGEIARRELGSAKRWEEIQSLNGSLDPKRLRAGMTIKLPGGQAATGNAPSTTGGVATPAAQPRAGGRTYTVKSGDTLGEIAKRELGSAQRWNEIQALNPGLNPNRMVVGAELVLPQGGGSRVATAPRQPAVDERRVAAAAPATRKSKVQ
jgi:nucleoid-associated protein YgaU